MNNEFGDFQTPDALVTLVHELLVARGFEWSRVLEPTCGTGAFLRGFAESASELVGIEIQEDYCEAAQESLLADSGAPLTIRCESIFDTALDEVSWQTPGPLLVVGNPPWVTNADLGRLKSSNLPRKQNLKLLNGLDAMTGASNFDIAEFIWLKIIEDLRDDSPLIALLCKTQTARNVLEYVFERNIPAAQASIHRIDAMAHFGAAVDACLFVLDLDRSAKPLSSIPVFESLGDTAPSHRLIYCSGALVRDLGDGLSPSEFLSECEFEWRQGLKHDAARVMELSAGSDGLINRAGEAVDVERRFVYPLAKSTDLFHGRTPATTARRVLLYQRELGAATSVLESEAPRLWRYLLEHSKKLDGRGSSIYRSQPRFALFGVGPYTFAPYKVAVSGLHKEARFRLLPPLGGKPVVVDDTCYFLAFDDPGDAALVAAVLNSPSARALLGSISFADSKRPIKKSILKRISIGALATRLDPERTVDAARVLARDAGMGEITIRSPSLILEEQLPLFGQLSG